MHVGEEEVKKRGREEDEDSGCYSVEGGKKYERKIKGRHRSKLHVGRGEVKKKGG